MFAEERRAQILRLTEDSGGVDVQALSESLGVTPETVRRDLTTMERQGLIRRVHGGAVPVGLLPTEVAYHDRERLASAEKDAIAKAALDEVPAGGAIVIDAGTTTRRFAELIPHDRELVVVVNSPDLAALLSSRTDLSVMMLGGRIRSKTHAVVGELTSEFLSRMRFDVAFMATNGISPEHGLTTPDMAESLVKQRMIESSRRVVLLADSSKIGASHFARFAEVNQVDKFITDNGADPALVAKIEELGPEVLQA